MDYEGISNHLLSVHDELRAIDKTLQSGPVRLLHNAIRSAAALLSVPINLATPNRLVLWLSDPASDAEYKELLVFIYRAAITHAYLNFEAGLHEWCTLHGVVVRNSFREQWLSLRNRIEAKLTKKELQSFDDLEPRSPSMADVLRAAGSVLSEDRRKLWIDYFAALDVVRNKLSHSQNSLSQREQEKLQKANVAIVIDESGRMNFNALFLLETMRHLVGFFREIDEARPLSKC